MTKNEMKETFRSLNDRNNSLPSGVIDRKNNPAEWARGCALYIDICATSGLWARHGMIEEAKVLGITADILHMKLW